MRVVVGIVLNSSEVLHRNLVVALGPEQMIPWSCIILSVPKLFQALFVDVICIRFIAMV